MSANLQYWVVKGRPDENDFVSMLVPGMTERWHTGKPPSRLWHKHDRVFFWESTPSRKLVGLGEILDPFAGIDANGDTLYEVRYLTKRFRAPIGIEELRNTPIVNDASFLKAGPAGSVFRLSLIQAQVLIALISFNNIEAREVWPEIERTGAMEAISRMGDIAFSAREGAVKRVEHLIRERDRNLIQRKKERTSNFQCEVCSFDFQSEFGELGTGFCEVHHRIPLASLDGETETTLDDLAIVCSNCHRMLHRSNPMLSIEALRELRIRTRSIQ